MDKVQSIKTVFSPSIDILDGRACAYNQFTYGPVAVACVRCRAPFFRPIISKWIQFNIASRNRREPNKNRKSNGECWNCNYQQL